MKSIEKSVKKYLGGFILSVLILLLDSSPKVNIRTYAIFPCT